MYVLSISITDEKKVMFSDVPINNGKGSSAATHVQRSSSSHHSSLLGVTRTTLSDPPLPTEDEPSLEDIRS